MLPSIDEIKQRRKKLDLTQKQLAKVSNASQSVIAKIESKKINPSYLIFKKIFDALDLLEKKEVKKAKDILSSKIVTIRKQDTIKKAIAAMNKFNYSQLPVVNKGIIIGSITEKSIVDLIASGKNITEFSSEPIEKIMIEPFPRISESTPITTISVLLQDNQAVLVTHHDKIVGIITKSDFFKISSTNQP